MCLRVCGTGNDKPLYALQHEAGQTTVIEDIETGLLAVIKRLYLQIVGKLDYNFFHIAAHMAVAMDAPFKGHSLGKVAKDFRVQLHDREIKIMARFARVDHATWTRISHFGRTLLQISNDNWYQQNDVSFNQTAHAIGQNQGLLELLRDNRDLHAACNSFVARCPSQQYRVIVRLALKGSHETSGSNGAIYR